MTTEEWATDKKGDEMGEKEEKKKRNGCTDKRSCKESREKEWISGSREKFVGRERWWWELRRRS